MNLEQDFLVPKKFCLQFRSEIEKNNVLAKTPEDNSYFTEIYFNSFDLQRNKPLIQNKLAEIGISEENSINLVLLWLKDLQQFYKKFDQLIESQKLGNINDHDEQKVVDWKFQLFIHKKYMTNQLITKFLDEVFSLEINNPTALYLKLASFNQIMEFQAFKDKLTPILLQLTDYDDKSQEKQAKICHAFFHRNLCLDLIKSTNIENLLENNTLQICLDILYDNIQKLNLRTIEPVNLPQETYQQFSIRLTPFMDGLSKKFEGWKVSKKNQFVQSLFQQVPDYDYEKIVSILIESKIKEVASKQLITDDLLMKIFNVPSGDIFKKQNQSKSQAANNSPHKAQKVNNLEKESGLLQKSPNKKPSSKNQESFEYQYLKGSNDKNHEEKTSIKSPVKVNQSKEKEEEGNAGKKCIQQQSIKRLIKQIKLIRFQTKNKSCIEIIVRQLQIALLEGDQKKINEKAQNLRELVNKYRLRTNCFSDIDELEIQVKPLQDRLPKISSIRKKLYVINLIDVLEGKNYIENERASMCKDANAILIIGRTGAGKSTLMTALAGFKLIYNSQTGDYRAENQSIAQQIPISNRQQSETRWANVKRLSKIYSNGKDLIIIDTPGFQDNRGIEIELTNNIATINLIKKLSSARILIVLPQQQFYGARQIENYTKFIRLFSGYFFNVKDFQYSINIVLTKGLTGKQLLKTIGQIEITQTFRNIDWSQNEKNFQNILKRKLKDLRRQNQIIDPPKHQFDSLMEGVLELQQKQSPGDDICQSFSSTALQALQQTSIYLEKMVKETFQEGEFQLTSFYLSNIKQLDSIQKSSNFHQVKNFLKQAMEKKVKTFHSIFKKFLSSNNDEWLNELKTLREYFYNPESEPIYKLLFYNQLTNISQPNPKEIFDAQIQAKISAARLNFQSAQNLDNNKKIQTRSTLKMMKLFGFDLQYRQISTKISNSLVKIHKKLQGNLDQNQFNNDEWITNVQLQINQFKENQDSHSSDTQKYEFIRKIVQKYISNNNQLDQIMNLKDKAMVQCLDGKLKKICTQYLEKLNKIKETHYSIKQAIEPKFKEILNELDILIASYQEKQMNEKTINIADFQMWENFNQNRNEIFQIKAKFADSQILQFNNLKQDESMLKLFLNNLIENIDSLQKIITGIPKNPEHIDPDQIHEKLETIFGLLEAMEKKKQSSNGQIKQKDRKQQTLKRTLDKSYQKINAIISSIERTCSIELIRNYQLNLKLMNSLTVILEFQEFKQKILDEKMKQKLETILNSIILKIESPLKNIENDPFTTLFSFEKLWNVLHYMNKLDIQTRLLGGKAINFHYNVDFSENEKIRNTVSNSLEKMKIDYELLKPIRELSTYGVKSSIKVTSSLEEQKKKHIENLQYELLEDAIKYIKSYKFVRNINEDFFEDLSVVQNFKRQLLQKLDLKEIVKSRIKSINAQLSRNLSLDYLKQIGQEFNFFNKIHQNTKTPEQIEYIDIQNKINQKLKNYGKSFDSLYEQACELYQDVQNRGQGVEYEFLNELLDNPGRRVQEGQQKLKKLLSKIDQRYQKVLTKYYIEQNPNGKVSNNANIFLNIIEFKKICQNTTYKCKLQENLHKSGLENLFSQVTNGFQILLEEIKKGRPINQNEKNMLIRYQKKIALLLKTEYDQFKKSKGITDNYFISFEKRKKQIIEKVIGLYSKKQTLCFDENFLQIYENSSPQIRESIKRVAISKNQDEVEQKKHLIKDNHQELFKFYSSKMEQGKNMPEQIFESLMSDMKPLLNQVAEIEQKNKNIIQEATSKKVPNNIILCFLKGDSMNNEVIRKSAVEAVKNYFQEEEKTLDFVNLQNLEENLQRNITLTTKDDFKKASEKNKEFNNASSKYVLTVKSKFQQRTRTYDKQVNQFKQLIRKRKLGQSFQLSETKLKPQQYEALSKGAQTYQVVSKHKQHFVQQIDNFKKVIQQRVKQGNKELKDAALKLENIKRQIIEKKIGSSQSIVPILEQVHSKRVLSDAFGEVFNGLDGLDTKIQQQALNNHDSLLNDIKKDLRQKYDDSVSWNLDKFIENQMIVCNSKENQQNQKVLNLLNTCIPIFFPNNQFPANISKNIQQNTEKQFEQFQKSVLNDIENFFVPSVECSSQNVMKYYKLINKMKETRSLRFSQNMKIDNKVKEKLLSKFKLNVNQIISFIQKPEKLEKYNKFLDNIKKTERQEKLAIQQLKKKTDLTVREQCQKIEDKINSQKSTITAEDPDRSTKLAKFDDQCKADKLSKENDLNKLFEKNTNALNKSYTKTKEQIISDLNSYLTTEIVNPLIVFQRAVTYFYCEKDIKDSVYSVKSFCKQIQDKYKKTIFRYMYSILKNIDSPHAQALTNQKCFESITQSNWRELVSGITFENLMKSVPHLKEISQKQKFIDERFKKFQEIYKELTEVYKKASDFNQTKKKLVQDTKIMGEKISDTYMSDNTCKFSRWELVARIAAIWTIHKSQFNDDNCVQFIHKPHSGQILAIFMLLQFDEKSITNQIKNTMVQVSTGEGKSVILGIISTYLALVGFKVYEACYSNYLSERDYFDFESLFNLFGVKDKIFYRTFPEICRMMLQESPDKPFIGKIEKLLTNPSIWTNIASFLWDIFPGSKQGKKILLLDEADAFLDENYLGESFFPSINLKKKSVENLLNFVWNYREKLYELTPQVIVGSKQFDTLCKQLSNKQFRSLMQNQAHAMVRDLGNYKQDIYSLIDGEIYYKTGDSLTNKVHYGYRTVFNYYHEFYINKRISQDQFQKHVSINLIIASFSYSMLPSYFSSILGVTGTLDCMSKKQKQILTDRFGVKRTFIQPSIYPSNRRLLQFFKCSEDKLFQQVAKSIEKQHAKKRPIVVFFESKNKVYDFYNSQQFSKFKTNATIVTHQVSAEDRTFRIETSTADCKITLLTVDFSRGTDFKLNAKDADKHPGLHVICAFIPNSFSDYLQVVGRTGRQGKNGSVSLYFVDFTLTESLVTQIKQDDAEKMISKLDNDHWNNKYDQLTIRMNRADSQHEMSTALYTKDSSADKIFKQMQVFNLQYPVVRTISRTVIGIDATVSMGNVFAKLISVIQTSLPQIHLVIQDAKVAASFQIKFVIYRNYNSKAEDLLAYSNFQNKTQILAEWLKQITVSGGWGNQALEICLQHINSLQNVNQYVIISDAKGHHPDEVMQKRQRNGHAYFESKGFPFTTVGQQVDKLSKRQIKGHFYYLSPRTTEAYYKKVSQKAGGIAQQFPIDDKNSSKIFGDFIAERILQNIESLLGGNNAGSLVQRYKARSQ